MVRQFQRFELALGVTQFGFKRRPLAQVGRQLPRLCTKAKEALAHRVESTLPLCFVNLRLPVEQLE